MSQQLQGYMQNGMPREVLDYYKGYSSSVEHAASAYAQDPNSLGGWWNDYRAGKNPFFFQDSIGGHWMPWWEGGNSVEDRTSGNAGKLLGYRTASLFGESPGRTNTYNLHFDPSGKYTHEAFGGNTIGFLRGIGMVAGAALGMNAAFGGAGAAASGSGAGAGAGVGAGGATAADIGTMYAGADAASAATLGGGASVGGGAALGAGAAGAGAVIDLGSGLGIASDGSIVGNTLAGGGTLTNAQIASMMAGEGFGAAGGLSGIIEKLGTQAGKAFLNQLFNGGSGGQGSGGGAGGTGLTLGDILGIIGGGVDANRQGKAAETMRAWLDSQGAKMEGYFNPQSPEYNQLWDQMSRQDARAGRNSQYGPRTSDFLANVAGKRADNIRQFTTGTAIPYANALNQDASKYAGLASALNRTGNNMSLDSIIGALGGGIGALTNGGSQGVPLSNEAILDMIYQGGGAPIDYGNGMADPTDADVWDYMLNEGGWDGLFGGF